MEESELLLQYIPILLIAIAASAFAIGSVLMSFLIGKKKPSEVKNRSYECGMEPIGDARERFSVKFFLVAMSFVVFDIEAVYFLPWSVIYRPSIQAGFGMYMFVAILIFAAILILGLVYEWRRGVLDWGPVKRGNQDGS